MHSSLLLTGFYGGILAILYIALTFKVIGLRKKHSVGIGDGENSELAKAIRIHGNFSEYVPIALILFAAFELNGGSAQMLHLLGGLLVTARFLHAIGLGKSTGTSWQRFSGTVATFIVLLILAVCNILAMF
ncbi:MAPEG family protein [Thalassotalea nanhaiensis]|uniref:MAPEG family protein n=1 Tax=Thalassotalea nanhaiensis TaxID=3065648 RepID=A0ABY9TM36_9GAMM|nr:MAPEG family protein [Colwelliaceae bacterium SQ345]